MRRRRLSVLLAVEAGIALCPAFSVPVVARAATDPDAGRTVSAERAGSTAGSTEVAFRVLPAVVPPPVRGPSAVAGSGNDTSVDLGVGGGGHGASLSGSSGHEHSRRVSGPHGRGPSGRGWQGHGAPRSHGRPRLAGHHGRAHKAALRHGRLPFTGGDVGPTALAALAALLAGIVALCVASVRRRRGITRDRRRALPYG